MKKFKELKALLNEHLEDEYIIGLLITVPMLIMAIVIYVNL